VSRRRRARWPALAIAALIAAASGRAAASPSQDLDRARQAFREHDYESAAKLATYLLYPEERLGLPVDLVEAHVILGASAFEIGHRAEAKREFERALQIQPEKVLTDMLFSDGAIRLFDETRADIEARARRDAELRKIADERERIRKYRESMVVVERRSFFVNFMPFGAGQFQNHNYRRAYFFAATQGTTFLTSIGIFAYLARTYGFVGKVPLEDGPRVRTLQQVEIVTGAAFFVFYTLGVVDSIRHFKARTNIKTDDSILNDLPDDLKLTPPKKPKATSLRDRLHLGPILTPGGVGLGLSLESD